MSSPQPGPLGRVTLRLVLLAVIPLIALAISLFVVSRVAIVPMVRRHVLEDISVRNKGTHALIENWVQEQRRVLRHISDSAATIAWDPVELRVYAQRSLATFPGLGAVVFVAPDGTVIADTEGESGWGVGDRAYFQAAMQGESVVSNVISVRTSAEPVVIIAEPVRFGPDEIGGVVFAPLNPAALSELVETNTETGPGATRTYLLDGQNQVICGPCAGTVVDQDFLPSGDTTAPYMGWDGREMYGVVQTVELLKWQLVTEIHAGAVVQIPRQYNNALIQTVTVGALIAIGIALLIGRSIQVPLAQLDRLARRVGAGNYRGIDGMPETTDAPVELRNLRSTIMEMAETITNRQRQLEQSNHLLGVTQRMAHLGSWEFDPHARTVACSAEALRLLGLPEERGHLRVEDVLGVIHGADKPVFAQRFVRSVRDGTDGFEMEHWITPSGAGEARFVHQRCVHVRGSDGSLLRTLGMVHDITERHQFAESLHDALKEKTALLQEVQHRVRNNLSVVRSLLSLKRDYLAPDCPAYHALNDTYSRITSMALLHDQLYDRDNLDQVDLADYVSALIDEIRVSYGRPGITFETRLDSYTVDLTTGIPCGMILNELVVNASKHAFPGGTGTIAVTLSHLRTGRAELVVTDDGIGFDPVAPAATGLGSELVHQLIDQIDGTIAISTDPGVRVTVQFAG
ncbi:MAG: cache domain-containing protein [Spirochaeta sp.]|nr:cache domain-containing protein [Spirochaeta sp.]